MTEEVNRGEVDIPVVDKEDEVVLSDKSQILCDSLISQLQETGRMPIQSHEVLGLASQEKNEIMRRLGAVADKLVKKG